MSVVAAMLESGDTPPKTVAGANTGVKVAAPPPTSGSVGAGNPLDAISLAGDPLPSKDAGPPAVGE